MTVAQFRACGTVEGMGRPTSPLATREKIIAEATALIDEGGLPNLTTRRLAARLGIKGPSIYNHFPTMDAVADAVIDSILEEVDNSSFDKYDWRTAIPIWARDYWSVLQKHRGIVPLMAQGPGTRTVQLQMADRLYGALTDGGWPPRQATEVAIAIRNYIAGSALGSYSGGFPTDEGVYGADLPHLGDAHRLPEYQASLDAAAFERGLNGLMDGLVLSYASEVAGLARRAAGPEG
jgi:AcrR family transcriptional regulator